MDKPTTTAEILFARALDLPAGAARDDFLTKECASDPALRQEVESLLKASEEAGDFLEPLTVSTATVGNAAEQAAAFLRQASGSSVAQIEQYVCTLPAGIRREAQERIEAGLRVRKLKSEQGHPGLIPDEPVPSLPGYHIDHKIGAGNLGIVYAAHDEKLDRNVAIKVLRAGADKEVRRRILDEARKAAALGDPGVVTIFAVLDEANPPAIVMERVEGFPLDRFAAELSFEQKARLLREVARALAAAHERGLVHRDLKPENIIVGPDMRPRILDFGLALSLDEAGRQTGGFEGTPLYASPEQVLGRPLAPSSDVFSFGSLMFKVLTGRSPFSGDSVRQVLEAIAVTAPPFLRNVAVGVPDDLQAICLACLAWNPADRPAVSEIALELGRYLVGEPVRLRPKLYDDLLRRSITEYASQAQTWESQSIISREERDSLEIVHRRLLADEDHWIIDARRITFLQTILSGGTWLAVVATLLTVWMLRNELGAPWRWLLPTGFTLVLLTAGSMARRTRESLAAATFLAGAALAIAPCTLSLLGEIGVFAKPAGRVTQLFDGTFTNQQVLIASLTALAVSGFGLWRLKMTGFAWTTAALITTSYLSMLLLFNWLDQKPEVKALWCLPLITTEPMALLLERKGRVRWTLPFHLVALLTLVAGLDVIAMNGPTLKMLGITGSHFSYFDQDRLQALSFALNGAVFLGLMLLTERSASLDLRRASKMLEILAIIHTLSALFANAMGHRSGAYVRVDVWLYISTALLFTVLAPFRSRWRMLAGGLVGCGLGSYLLVDLGLVARRPFIIGLGIFGLALALGTFVYVRSKERLPQRTEKSRNGLNG